MKAAIAHGGLMGGFASTTPSKGRHGSVTESLGEQTAGSMFHEILPRAAAKAFATWGACNVLSEEEEDMRIYIKRKTWRAKQHLTSQRAMQRGAMISWVAEPVDHLWIKLQYLDARTSLMLDLQLPRADPFQECLRDLSSTLLLPISEGPLQHVFFHYAVGDADVRWLIEESQVAALGILCQLHWRFVILFRSWPFPLTQLVDVRIPKATKDGERDRFLNEPECCLDDDFSLKLRKLCPTAAAMEDPEVRSALLLWARQTRLSNMLVERLLALFKASCSEKHPDIQRLVASSLLAQWRREHHRAGGADPRQAAPCRKELLRRGVPLVAARSTRRKRRKVIPRRARGVFSYVKKHGTKTKLKLGARLEEKRLLSRQFYALDRVNRQPFIAMERADVEVPVESDADRYDRLSSFK